MAYMNAYMKTMRSHQTPSLLLMAILVVATACASAPEPPASANTTVARTESERAVLAAVQSFFTTMNSKDAAGARMVLDSAGDFVSVRTNDSGQQVIRRSANTGFLGQVATMQQTYLERMWDADVYVHGPIAVVWTPYDFHVDGKFSHCGVDIFNLVKTNTGWQVTSGTYTVEQTGCADSPLGPP